MTARRTTASDMASPEEPLITFAVITHPCQSHDIMCHVFRLGVVAQWQRNGSLNRRRGNTTYRFESCSLRHIKHHLDRQREQSLPAQSRYVMVRHVTVASPNPSLESRTIDGPLGKVDVPTCPTMASRASLAEMAYAAISNIVVRKEFRVRLSEEAPYITHHIVYVMQRHRYRTTSHDKT